MYLVNLTTARLKRFTAFSFALFFYTFSFGQDNSPYSRFGLGDVVPNQNISTRGMGGIAAGYSDFFNINFKNPASLGVLSRTRNFNPVTPNTVFDLGGEIDVRTLKSTATNNKYSSTNTTISYLQLAFPIATSKMEKKGVNWALSFGIRPINRINYKVEKNERLTGIDSLNTLYEGSGGVSQANVSTGIKIRNFSIGASSGYTFGNRDYSTQKVFINDTVNYYKSNTQAQSHFGGIFINTGIQYQLPVRKSGFLKLGAYANFEQHLRADEDNVNETFAFDGNGGIAAIDTINSLKDQKGKIKLPATYGFGFTYQDSSGHWLAGADFEITSWDSYRYFDLKDNVQNNWTLRVGAEYYPLQKNTGKVTYWRFVKYRAGFYFGPDYIKLDQNRYNYAGTIGASFPLTTANKLRTGDFVQLNTSIEVGGRGNNQTFSFRENTVRICIGLSMNANWFQKRSYY